MSVNNIKQILGQNIKQARKRAGLSATELADKISELSGEDLSRRTIYAWERAERTISDVDLYYLAMALQCNIDWLFRTRDYLRTKDLMQRICLMSRQDQEILRYAIVDWDGDFHALLQWNAKYMMMPEYIRAEAASSVILTYQLAKDKGVTVNTELDFDDEYLDKAWFKLMKTKKK